MFNKKEYKKQYQIKNREELKEYNRQYYIKNREEAKEYQKRCYKNNPEKAKEYSKQWLKNNPEKARENHRKYMRLKSKIDLKFNLNKKMSTGIWQSLRGNKNGRHWETLVGYTLSNLIKRLNKTMPKGYIWQDYMEGKLHIDHRIPISAFNFTKPKHTDFKRCWSLDNLRLLPAKENLIKHNKLERPFQPALAF